MIKNKKLLIGLICLAFCVCCAVFGISFTSKNSIVAKADTIPQATNEITTATAAKSINFASHEAEEYQAVGQAPALDEPEENQDITYEESLEMEESENDGSEATEYGFVVPPPPYPSMRKTVTFIGHVDWIDDYGKEHPLRQVKIQITDYEDSDYTVYTDDKGNFTATCSVLVFNKIDIIAYATDDDENVQVKLYSNYGSYSCVLKSEISIPTSSSTEIILNDLAIDMSTQRGQAFQILQAVITVRDFASKMLGWQPWPITVIYPVDETAKSSFRYLHYSEQRSEIHIRDLTGIYDYPNTYASWDIIMHEYGHHVQKMLGIKLLGLDHYINRDSADTPYNYKKNISIQLAWQESWPTVFGMLAQRYYVEKDVLYDIKTVGDSYYTGYDRNFDLNATTLQLGDRCEVSIMASLWNLFDSENDENDTVSLSYDDFWILTTENGIDTFWDFIADLYTSYPNLIYDIGANLSYHQMAAYNLSVTSDSHNAPPTFSWEVGGGKIYLNNFFELVIYNANGNEILRKSGLTTNCYTLSLEEAKQIDYWESSTYWTVEATNDYDNIITGPYISQKKLVSKPYNLFTIGLNRSIQVTSGETIWFFKFTAPTAGNFTFYTEGGSDTYGEACSQIYNYKDYLKASDDNSGDSANFKITLNLKQNECVYIRVTTKVFWRYYNMRVKQE